MSLSGASCFQHEMSLKHSGPSRRSHVRRVLTRLNYARLSLGHKGVVVRCLQHTSGYSRQHLVRLIGRFVARAPLGRRKPPVAGFYRRYTETDVRLLAQTDAPRRGWRHV
ncbi:MAG: hypothetical protein ACTS5I_13030 [Rhodanobacter sp.]